MKGPLRSAVGATRRHWILVAGVVALVMLVSCTNLGYYSQSVLGGAAVLAKRKSVKRLLADEATPQGLRDRLALAQEMRDFAVEELGLPDNSSYRKYADLGRPYAVWNVVAAPELSIAPRTWCFLFVGCVAYRGYFSEERARRFADKLSRQGFDVDVGGVTAYSTVGWFADPLLSTFIHRAEPQLAGLLFHELAHQRVFIKGDTTFNESFAMAVEEHGATLWLEQRGHQDQIEEYRRGQARERQFSELVLDYRGRLAEAYGTDRSDDWKRERKRELLSELETSYARLKESWDGYAGFDGWFGRDLNNARLALIGVYHQRMAAFLALLESHGGELEPFYAEVEEISRLPHEERHERLRTLSGTEAATG